MSSLTSISAIWISKTTLELWIKYMEFKVWAGNQHSQATRSSSWLPLALKNQSEEIELRVAIWKYRHWAYPLHTIDNSRRFSGHSSSCLFPAIARHYGLPAVLSCAITCSATTQKGKEQRKQAGKESQLPFLLPQQGEAKQHNWYLVTIVRLHS